MNPCICVFGEMKRSMALTLQNRYVAFFMPRKYNKNIHKQAQGQLQSTEHRL